MSHRPRAIYVFAAILVLLCALSSLARPRKARHLSRGLWGGPHIRINVTGNSAAIEYDCANGTIKGPLTLNSTGKFEWRGSHSRERGGPVRLNDNSGQRTAVYSGWVKGGTMNLTVKLVDSGEDLGTFTLSRGSSGKVFKCR
jgi:hypothetical protein